MRRCGGCRRPTRRRSRSRRSWPTTISPTPAGSRTRSARRFRTSDSQGPEDQAAMPTTIIVPQLGESVVEGTIGKWLKKIGEPIAKDEPVVEIITDKINIELPAPVAGSLGQILLAEGTVAQVGQELGVIRAPGESLAGAPAAASAPAAPAAAPAPAVPAPAPHAAPPAA